jgi:hypothetical protein
MLLSSKVDPELVSVEPQSYGSGIRTVDAALNGDNNTTRSCRDFTRNNSGLETALRSLGAPRCSSSSFHFIPFLFSGPLVSFLHFAFIVCPPS